MSFSFFFFSFLLFGCYANDETFFQIMIFHRFLDVATELPGKGSEGHTAVVNCVNWHPHLPGLLVSSSDDGSVRLWGSKRYIS